jgi:DNA-binding winged helix-turn-helix (wHTH) protein/tetratricopeptide (TPR) repeat protein
MASPTPVPTRIHFDAFELDAASGELRKAGILLKLRPQPFRVLLLLIEQAGQVVSREEIQRCLWADSTFVDFEHGINFSINQIRGALADSAENPRYVETIPRRGYRFIGAVEQPPAGSITGLKRAPEPEHEKAASWHRLAISSLLIVVVATFVTGIYLHFHHAPVLTEKDTIVLADFTNTTGDGVLDDTLRQGLAAQLEQSPFLNLISDERIQRTLSLMGQPSNVRLTPTIAHDLCRRTNSAAVIDGSISRLGNEYVIGLDAVSCGTGQSLAREQVQMARKEDVLNSLSHASTSLRKKLGESLSSIQKFDMPLEEVSTPSLEALQAYSLGWKAMDKSEDFDKARSLFEKAVHLDPSFAMAHAGLGWSLLPWDGGQEETKRAYELRERVSERERFYIESHYYQDIAGNLDKLRETSELWVLTYPRDALARRSLGFSYLSLGQYDKSVRELSEAIALDPTMPESYGSLVWAYRCLNRLTEARATINMAQEKAHYPLGGHLDLYYLAFLQGDESAMAREISWALGNPPMQGSLLQFGASHTAAYRGKIGDARGLSRRAVASTERPSGGSLFEADAAITEALYGNSKVAQRQAREVLLTSKKEDWQWLRKQSEAFAGTALALSGESSQVQSVVDDLNKRFSEDTMVQHCHLPLIRALIALNNHNPSVAIQSLQTAGPYELGFALYPAYVRGLAYLAANQGFEAGAEFQKILDHRGLVVNDPIGALAHLGLARAYGLRGDTAKARAAYQDFLTLWKDADLDIPILKEAKAEYAKLQ